MKRTCTHIKIAVFASNPITRQREAARKVSINNVCRCMSLHIQLGRRLVRTLDRFPSDSVSLSSISSTGTLLKVTIYDGLHLQKETLCPAKEKRKKQKVSSARPAMKGCHVIKGKQASRYNIASMSQPSCGTVGQTRLRLRNAPIPTVAFGYHRANICVRKM